MGLQTLLILGNVEYNNVPKSWDFYEISLRLTLLHGVLEARNDGDYVM